MQQVPKTRLRGLLVVGGFIIAVEGCAAHGPLPPAATPTAATQSASPQAAPTDPKHLAVRPSRMATGTRNASAGVQVIDSVVSVYVPPSAVGTRRVPLVLLLHGSGGRALDLLHAFRRLADTTGFIFLAVQSTNADGWSFGDSARAPDEDNIDAALQQVLRRYAIDPTKMAVLGFSAGAAMALYLSYVNGDVFPRVLAFSPSLEINDFTPLPQHGTPSIFLASGADEGTGANLSSLGEWLSERGDSTRYTEYSGGHVLNGERAKAGLRWLIASWR